MHLFLLDMNGVLISLASGVFTSMLIAASAFLWKINGTLSVIMEKLAHIDQLASLNNQRWNEKFGALEKDLVALQTEFNEWRRGRAA